MLSVEINNKIYEFCVSWNDITLSRFSKLGTLVYSFPEWMKKVIMSNNVELTQEQAGEYVMLVRETCKILSDIPDEVLQKIGTVDLIGFFNAYLSLFVSAIYDNPEYQYSGIEKFTHKGTQYYLPTCDKDVAGNIMPCVNISTLELCEATDLKNASDQMSGGNFELAAHVISILCRPSGEKYDSKICKDRASEFLELPMNIVLEVFFCLEQLTTISGQNTQIYTIRENLLKKASRTKA